MLTGSAEPFLSGRVGGVAAETAVYALGTEPRSMATAVAGSPISRGRRERPRAFGLGSTHFWAQHSASTVCRPISGTIGHMHSGAFLRSFGMRRATRACARGSPAQSIFPAKICCVELA